MSLTKKLVGKPDAVAPHVRFDERGEETEPRRRVRHRQRAKAVGNSYSLSPKRHRVFPRLYPKLVRFLEIYPEISVDLRLTDTMVDLIEGGFDVAIRNASLVDSSFVARKLAPDTRIFCASPQYLKAAGIPTTIDDLGEQRFVQFQGIENCAVRTPEGIEHNVQLGDAFRLRTDNGDALRELTTAGAGISLNALWSVYEHLRDGRLIHVLPDHAIIGDASIWAVYPSSHIVTPKIRVFIDFYASAFGRHPYWERMTDTHSS